MISKFEQNFIMPEFSGAMDFFVALAAGDLKYISKPDQGVCVNYSIYLRNLCDYKLSSFLPDRDNFEDFLNLAYGDSLLPICTYAEYHNMQIPKYEGEMLNRRIDLAKRYLHYIKTGEILQCS